MLNRPLIIWPVAVGLVLGDIWLFLQVFSLHVH